MQTHLGKSKLKLFKIHDIKSSGSTSSGSQTASELLQLCQIPESMLMHRKTISNITYYFSYAY